MVMPTWPLSIPGGCPFTLENLPYGVFSTRDQAEKRVGMAVGEFILDLSVLEVSMSSYLDSAFSESDVIDREPIFSHDSLDRLSCLPSHTRKQLRLALIDLLCDERTPLFLPSPQNEAIFVHMHDAIMHCPFQVGNFSDFMCSDVHIENCSRIAGVTTPAAHYAMPLGYHARATSILVGSESITRPVGMTCRPGTDSFVFQESQRMDYEAELGMFVSKPLPVGRTITADEAEDHIFGFVILNDWSARDIQFSEMTPLGPFNGKAFGTSISPWVVTIEALEAARSASHCTDLRIGGSTGTPHLRHENEKSTWDISLEVSVSRPWGGKELELLSSVSNLRDLRWSPGQILAHMASSGCGLRTGDLIGTGTISSPNDSCVFRTLGCLIEITEGGKVVAGEAEGITLGFLQDGDIVSMQAKVGQGLFGFGTLRTQLVPPSSSDVAAR